jgi:hypothetical protein
MKCPPHEVLEPICTCSLGILDWDRIRCEGPEVDINSLKSVFSRLNQYVRQTGSEANFDYLSIVNSSLTSLEDNFLGDVTFKALSIRDNDNLALIRPKAFKGSIKLFWQEMEGSTHHPGGGDPSGSSGKSLAMECPPIQSLAPICKCFLNDLNWPVIECDGPEVDTKSLREVFSRFDHNVNETGSNTVFWSLKLSHSSIKSLDQNFLGSISFVILSLYNPRDMDMIVIEPHVFRGSVQLLMIATEDPSEFMSTSMETKLYSEYQAKFRF